MKKVTRSMWLDSLKTDDPVGVGSGPYMLDGKVVRQTKTLNICLVWIDQDRPRLHRFRRNDGSGYGNYLTLEIPQGKTKINEPISQEDFVNDVMDAWEDKRITTQQIDETIREIRRGKK